MGEGFRERQNPTALQETPTASGPSSSPVPKTLPFPPCSLIELEMFPRQESSPSPLHGGMALTWHPWGSFASDRRGFANKISFSSPASLFRGLVCSTSPENLGQGELQDENPAHDGRPGSTSQAISAFLLPAEAHREEAEEEGEEELKVGAVPEVLGCPVPSGSQLPPPPRSLALFPHQEHPSSSQTGLQQ